MTIPADSPLQQLLNCLRSQPLGSADNNEFHCDRVLTDAELVTACYQDLIRWRDNKPGSPSQQLQQRLLAQFEQAYPGIEHRPPVEGVDFDWLIQEYICGASGDYSFGVYQAGIQRALEVQAKQDPNPSCPIAPDAQGVFFSAMRTAWLEGNEEKHDPKH
ncbi:hypothetical protein [uncultured Ferrimonas sp.]|uniref:hypothetical protein n=1 Tax=uncultured Ferrimonas sp. TaxID=432640 RepID=UPI0026129B4C|nr:hypothetical protein [uncultured Ferrimonas sp.]